MRYEGRVVLNYRLSRKLGEGGFGVVYLAEHVELGRKAACKILHPEFARREELVARFFREAKTVCAIGHKAIIDVENFGMLESGEPFYLMEYFDGSDLSTMIKDKGSISLDKLVAIFDPVASALSAAHAKGVVHRDLKPENIMVRERDGAIDDVKLLDFGIAKLLDSAHTNASRTGMAMGTPAFMAPEQSRDAKNVDRGADIYGFAATLFAAIAGRPPFVGDNLTDVIVAVQTTPAPRLDEFVQVPPQLVQAVADCLQKRPEQRPPSISAAWTALKTTLPPTTSAEGWVSGQMATASPGAATGPFQTTLGGASAEIASAPESARRWPLLLGISALAALVGIIVAVSTSGGSDSKAGDNVSGQKATASRTRLSTPDEAGVAATVDAASSSSSALSARGSTPTPNATKPDNATSAKAPSVKPASVRPPSVRPPSVKSRPREEKRRARRKVSKRTKAAAIPASTGKARTKARRSSLRCKQSSFAAIYNDNTPSSARVQSALRRLKTCRARKLIDHATYTRIQTALVAKL